MMMNLLEERKVFEQECEIFSAELQHFGGVPGWDVYNPSIPFQWNGKSYIFGRVERRNEWGNSTARLFEMTSPNHWQLVPQAMIYPLEDPFFTRIKGELVLGGVHVQYSRGQLDTYRTYFLRGKSIEDLRYFTTGPDFMKDIRLIELPDGRIGIFSRPRDAAVLAQYGCESQIGFTSIDSLDELDAAGIAHAPYIPGFFEPGEWGGCNQAVNLRSGLIGIIGHLSYNYGQPIDGHEQQAYLNVAWVFDPVKHELLCRKIIGTRNCYPASPAKEPWLTDVAFTSGIVPCGNGKVALYSGLGDAAVGKIVIPDPFAQYGGLDK